MIDFKYLYQGLCGMANAHRANAMAGHLGAAVITGYFWGEDIGDLDEQVCRGVEKELERIIKGEEAIWFNPAKAKITTKELFQKFDDEEPQIDQIPKLVEALAQSVDQPRQSGHNVIFASIAVRALSGHDTYARPSIIAGIEQLILGFKNAGPGRGYYGKDRGWIKGNDVALDQHFEIAPYRSEQAMAEATIDQLIQSTDVRRRGFGGMWHIINHAAAITELARFGYRDLAKRALLSHRKHLQFWMSLPDVQDELGLLERSRFDPRDAKYWGAELFRDDARLTHRIKTLYGFHTLMRFIEDAGKRKHAEEALRFLMA